MTFGEKLKELRIEKAKMGLGNFAIEISMNPSELSKIERGIIPPPSDEKLWEMIYVINMQSNMHTQFELFNLQKEPFVMKKMPEDISIPFPPHKKDGSCLSPEEVEELKQHLIQEAREHNKKADEYNEKHKGQD